MKNDPHPFNEHIMDVKGTQIWWPGTSLKAAAGYKK
jgi:hypothetical protein